MAQLPEEFSYEEAVKTMAAGIWMDKDGQCYRNAQKNESISTGKVNKSLELE